MLRPAIGITMGDPAGIGPEVILKALGRGRLERYCRPIVIGSSAVMARAGGAGLPMIDCVRVDLRRIPPGKVSRWAGQAAAEALQAAVRLALEEHLAAVVTGPVSKQALHLAGHRYPGQTEFLARLCGAKKVAMMLATGKLRVALATTHIPLGQVSASLTRARVRDVILLADSALRELFGIRHPRVAVCALNPHAGDGGIFGSEEGDIIGPAVHDAKRRGLRVQGPLPADTLFAAAARQRYDVVVAMYHDQGLIPVKMSGFGTAVNITLGLPIIRTSPDHGTAFDIAAKGSANPDSMIRAVRLAAQLARARMEKGSRHR